MGHSITLFQTDFLRPVSQKWNISLYWTSVKGYAHERYCRGPDTVPEFVHLSWGCAVYFHSRQYFLALINYLIPLFVESLRVNLTFQTFLLEDIWSNRYVICNMHLKYLPNVTDISLIYENIPCYLGKVLYYCVLV